MSDSFARPADDDTAGVPDFPDVDELETATDADEHDEDGDEDAPERAGASRARAVRRGVTRSDARRIIAKYLQLDTADEADLELLGTLYGVKADPTDLTVAVMTGSRAHLGSVNDLRAIADADPFEAAIVAASLTPPELKGVHALLVALGGASTKELPGGAVTKAAGRVARDVHGLDAGARARLDKVLGLTKRTA